MNKFLAALVLGVMMALPAAASAQVVVVRRPRGPRVVVVNPPGPGVVVVRRPRAPRVVVINPPGPGVVVVRRHR